LEDSLRTKLTECSRWIRLLFGREFDFKDVLRIWDVLFAEHLRSDIVDLTCVAMLLRNRWSLIGADYTTAITALTHYSLPDPEGDPRSLVRDAILREKNRDTETGAALIQRYSGKRPKHSETIPSRSSSATRTARSFQQKPSASPSASPSPGRFASQQRQLEGLFRDVTSNLQKRTEGWDVSRAVRSAVGEARRNMNNYQTTHSRQSSTGTPHPDAQTRAGVEVKREGESQETQRKLREIKERNVVLGKMLDDALQSLRALKMTGLQGIGEAEQSLNICLARIQFVSVYLSDPDIPIPKEEGVRIPQSQEQTSKSIGEQPKMAIGSGSDAEEKTSQKASERDNAMADNRGQQRDRDAHKPSQRPSLMDSSFSFMLGENRHRSSFVSSVSDLPEQNRNEESRSRTSKAVTETASRPERHASESKDDGFDLTTIQGGEG
jgi:TBC1 domain family member 5